MKDGGFSRLGNPPGDNFLVRATDVLVGSPGMVVWKIAPEVLLELERLQ